MTNFVSSDHHFNHRAMVPNKEGKPGWRPFESMDQMNEFLIDRWNDTVSPEDTVYYLGDLVMGDRAKGLEMLTGRLNGHIILTPGNHDYVHPISLKAKSYDWGVKYINMYRDAGIEMGAEYMRHSLPPVDGISYAMCHFPYEGDHTDEDRFPEYRPIRDPEIDVLLHGHVHDLWKVRGNQVNVGIDVWDFAPVEISVALNSAFKEAEL